MTAPIANLVEQTSISTGLGNFSLTTVQGRQSFNAAFSTGSGNTFYYFISNPNANEWEVGETYLSDAATLVRSGAQTVIDSSNGGLSVNFTSGTKDINNDLPAEIQATLVQPQGKVITAAGPYTLLTTDGIVEINQVTPAPFTVNIDPTALIPFRKYVVKDGKGDANTNNITLALSSGSFDGVSPFVMKYPWQAITFYSNGTNLRGIA